MRKAHTSLIKHTKAGLFSLLLLLFSGCAENGKEGNYYSEDGRIHPHFSITRLQLEQIISGVNEKTKENILKRSQYFLQLAEDALKLPEEILWLVDKKHKLPSDYEPSDLVPLTCYPLKLNREDLYLRRIMMPDVLALNEAARSDGVELVFSSTYRSYSYQDTVYKRNVNKLGKERADRESAQPGTSQHQLGTTIDFGSIDDTFCETEAGKWLFKNAHKYGFSLSYPEGLEEITGYRYECWHYRYISRTGSLLEQEFFEGVQQLFLEFWHEGKDALRKYLITDTDRST
ncbi:MAG: D-alanyl-D-alanine carboxypeptidase family protein [Spirochaetes bacterium]|mgnify:CR=1 FL=1|nr:MAG: D-alanyl-D-alanine carboxypeptidase family protein [Spirochaetota bacterium]